MTHEHPRDLATGYAESLVRHFQERRSPMAEDMVERLMLDFYASKAYDPKAARPADTVKAAIGFTIGAMSVVTPDKKRAGRRAVLSLDPENVLAEEIAIAAYLAMLNTSYPLEGSND